MSISEFSKTHGGTIAGLGTLSLAISILFAANGAFQRFDEVKGIAADVKTSVAEVKEVQAAVKKDLSVLRGQMPKIGTEAGEAGAEAVKAFRTALGCKEDDPCKQAEIMAKAAERLKHRQP